MNPNPPSLIRKPPSPVLVDDGNDADLAVHKKGRATGANDSTETMQLYHQPSPPMTTEQKNAAAKMPPLEIAANAFTTKSKLPPRSSNSGSSLLHSVNAASSSSLEITNGLRASSHLPPPFQQQTSFKSDRSGLHPRQEEREWELVTPEEIRSIEEDLRGMSVGSVGVAVPHETSTAAAPTQHGHKGGSGVGGSFGIENTLTGESGQESLLSALLETELMALPSSETAAYMEAQIKCPDLVQDEEKRAFLWKENDDPNLAAKRLARYWQYKLDLFGPHKSFQPMTLNGALSDDIVALSTGFVQILPEKDEHGRVVLFLSPGRHDLTKYSRESMTRAFFYILHVVSRESAARRQGIVCVMDGRSYTSSPFDPPLYRALMNLGFNYMAVMLRSIHYVHPCHLFHIVNPVIKMLVGERMRKRLIVHYGKSEDVLQSLGGYGLSQDRLPTEIGGKLTLNAVKWMTEQMIHEAPPPPTTDDLYVQPKQSFEGSDIDQGSKDPPDSFDIDSIFASISADQDGASSSRIDGDPRSKLSLSTTHGTIDSLSRKMNEEVRAGTNPSKVALPQPLDTTMSPKFESLPSNKDVVAPAKKDDNRTVKSYGDERMNVAIEAKERDPKMSLRDALIAGGFDFPARKQKGQNDKQIFDGEKGVSLFQRKNQLSRRLRARRQSDPRMSTSVAAKLDKPELSLLQTLLIGGFSFPKLNAQSIEDDRKVRDTDNITLFSRKNELRKKLLELNGCIKRSHCFSGSHRENTKQQATSLVGQKDNESSRQSDSSITDTSQQDGNDGAAPVSTIPAVASISRRDSFAKCIDGLPCFAHMLEKSDIERFSPYPHSA